MIKYHLQTLIIIKRGSCLLGGCIYNLDSLVGVIPMMVFPVCWYDEVKAPWRWCRCIETCRSACDILNIINMYVVHLIVWIINCARCTVHTLKYMNIIFYKRLQCTCRPHGGHPQVCGLRGRYQLWLHLRFTCKYCFGSRKNTRLKYRWMKNCTQWNDGRNIDLHPFCAIV